MALFERYIAIDYSGAKTIDDPLPGLRAYLATRTAPPRPVRPPIRGRHWTRRHLAEWLARVLETGGPTLVGIDHGFSFPLSYFIEHHLPLNWDLFLLDFEHHWPTHQPDIRVEDLRRGIVGHAARRQGNSRWLRLCDIAAGAAKSVFLFDVNGSVAKSTHAGLPWLLYLRGRLGSRAHFWPFDGWTPRFGASCICEIYPSLWRHAYPRRNRTPDQHDAYAACRRLREAGLSGELPLWLAPPRDPKTERLARIEGWILGVAPAPSPKVPARSA